MTLTRRQFEALYWIDTFVRVNGYSPSYMEIRTGLGLSSVATVHKHVTNLCDKGVLDMVPDCARSLEVTRRGQKILKSLYSESETNRLLGQAQALGVC